MFAGELFGITQRFLAQFHADVAVTEDGKILLHLVEQRFHDACTAFQITHHRALPKAGVSNNPWIDQHQRADHGEQERPAK